MVSLALVVTACGSTTPTSGSPTTGTQTQPVAAQPVSPAATRSQFLMGNISPTYPAGTAGQVALVSQAALTLPVPAGGETVPIAVRNNTAHAVTQITAQGTVKSTSGSVVATGSDQGFHPSYLLPGQVSLGFVCLGIGSNVPAGSAMSVQVSSTPAQSANTYTADLLITAANNTGQQLVGTLTNPRGHSIQGPYEVNVFCVATTGTLQAEVGGFADASNDLAAGATSGFTIDLAGTACPNYPVGASGYDQAAAGN